MVTPQDVEPIICPAEDNGKVITLHEKLGTMFGLTNTQELYLWATNSSSDYQFTYANANYVVSKMHFYDPEGRLYSTTCGFFGYWRDETSYRYPGVSFKTKQKRLKRLVLPQGFQWKAAYDEDLLFFVSRGKVGYDKPRVEVYIPFSYLKNLGFMVETTERNFINEYSKPESLCKVRLVTPKFTMLLASEYKVKE